MQRIAEFQLFYLNLFLAIPLAFARNLFEVSYIVALINHKLLNKGILQEFGFLAVLDLSDWLERGGVC